MWTWRDFQLPAKRNHHGRFARLALERLEDRTCPSSQGPVAVADYFATLTNGTISSPVPGVLANDTADNPGEIIAQLTSSPMNGQLAFSTDGSFTYTPWQGFTGSDSFEYRLFDGQTYSSEVAVSLHVALGALPTPSILADEGAALDEALATFSSSLDNATAADFTASIDWDDGNISNGQIVALGGNSFEVRGANTYIQDADYPIQITITDRDGNSILADNTATILNVDPQNVHADGGNSSVREGDAVSLTSSFADPGSLDVHSIIWQVTGPNGQSVANGNGPDFSFTPLDDGYYSVSLTVTDDDGGIGWDWVDIWVDDVAPEISISGNPSANEGETYTLSLTAGADPGSDTIESWEIDWGDGHIESVSGNPNSATHVYKSPGQYTISAYAVDDDGMSTASNTQPVTIMNVAPTISLSIIYGERNEVTLSGIVTDTDPFGMEVTFTGQVNAYTWANADGSFSLTTNAEGLGVIQATTVDWDGLYSNVAQVEVVSAAPVIATLEVIWISENYYRIQGTVTDESTAGLVVYFGGDFASLEGKSAVVGADGSFSLDWQIAPGESGVICADVADWWDLDAAQKQTTMLL